MSDLTTKQVMNIYEEAFVTLHGYRPIVSMNGSWISICLKSGDIVGNYRRREVAFMAYNLRKRIAQIDELSLVIK